MLKFYHHPLSPNSRRVWIALLEKDLPFEPFAMSLDGDQFQPEFLQLNPFHHIPVLVDDGFRVLESLATLDYLEAKYPTPALLPTEPQAIATVRMVQMVILNELAPATQPLMRQSMGLGEVEPQQMEETKKRVAVVLRFLEELLGDRPFFGSEHLTLGDIVAGVSLPWLPGFGISLADYPQLQAWSDRVMARPAWQQTQPEPAALEALKERMKARMAAPK